MSHYKSYPSYKDSEVEWLGAIPENWEISRLGFETWVRARLGWKGLKAEEYVDDGYAFLSTPDIKGPEIDFSDVNFITEERYEESPEIKLAIGDVLLAKDGSTLGTVNVVRKLPRAATVNSSIAVITPSQRLSSLYLYYLFKGAYLENTIQVLKGGMGVPHLFQWDINKFKIPLPSLVEQTKIAAHLDREIARIDALIEKKARFIELLREKRQALITHAVTNGLDPDVEMKDSGVEWLGEVPEHWDVLSFQRCVRIAEGQVDPEKSPYREMVLLAPNHIESGSGLLLYTETAEEQNAESGKYLCKKGDVVYSKIRPALRKVCIAPDLSLCSADMYPMQGHSGMSNQFLFWFLLSEPFSAFAVLEADRVAMPKINRESLNSVQLPRPPLNEQIEIVAWVEQLTARLDNLRAKTERSIELLKERRSAFITAAVTGQIDLRESV
ncbi:restriction endonuclease subunit S [Pseudomonas sp. A014]|uniref:restriction endonuclease subunit S n=1 Tax=Pseudomonas sp. A014 TaxID=3458058 RepID=UPI0040350B64